MAARPPALWRIQPAAPAFEMMNGICTPSTLDLTTRVSLQPLRKDSLVTGKVVTE